MLLALWSDLDLQTVSRFYGWPERLFDDQVRSVSELHIAAQIVARVNPDKQLRRPPLPAVDRGHQHPNDAIEMRVQPLAGRRQGDQPPRWIRADAREEHLARD